MGRNFSPSGARVLAAKKSVTEVSPPRTIFTASSTDIVCTAFSSSGLAAGTACSAARFIEVTRSSTRCSWPMARSIEAALFSAPGKRNPHLRVVEEAAGPAQQGHGAVGAALQRRAHARGRLGLAKREGVGGLRQQRGAGRPREEKRGDGRRKLTSLHRGAP